MASARKARRATAVQRLFGITELLEKILLELPMKPLITAHRVSTRFKKVIKGSVKIQRVLFLAPGAATDVAAAAKYHFSAKNVQRYWGNVKDVPAEAFISGITFNPFLVETIFPFTLGGLTPRCDFASRLHIKLLSIEAPDSRREMYITQPPMKVQTAAQGKFSLDMLKVEIEDIMTGRDSLNGCGHGGEKLAVLVDGILEATGKLVEAYGDEAPVIADDVWKLWRFWVKLED